jgi:hypothetical protein
METCVLASMPHLETDADCESVVPPLERLAPASIDLDVIERAERTLHMPTVPMGSIPMRTTLVWMALASVWQCIGFAMAASVNHQPCPFSEHR